MIKGSHVALIFILLLASVSASGKGAIRKEIHVDTLYGTIAFRGNIEVRKTPVKVSVHMRMIKLRFIPDAQFNHVPEARLRWIRFNGTYITDDDEVVSVHSESRPIYVNLDRDNRDGEFEDIRFDIHTDDFLRAEHVGFGVIAERDDQGRTVMWPMRVELRNLYGDE